MAATYTLKVPIKIKLVGPAGEREETITQLTLDFPEDGVFRAKHLRATDGHSGRVAMTVALLADLAGHPIKVMDELAEVDLMALMDMIEGFQRPGPSTGETV